jgi:Flp pilus assembly protein TadG
MTATRTDAGRLHPSTTKQCQSQKGTALVEFAFVLPVFLLILFGMITFSIAMFDKTVITMATRQGARAGALYVSGITDQTRRNNANAAALLACGSQLITFGSSSTPTFTSTISNNILTVQGTFPYTGLYIVSSISISAQTSMKLE